MKRLFRRLLSTLFLGILAAGFAAVGWVYLQLTTFEVVNVTDDLFMLSGLGGNVAVLRTDEGAVVVDTMNFGFQGTKVRQKAEELTGEKVAVIINTHYHSDHTHGNPGFPEGIRVISTARTLQHLQDRDADYWQEEAAGLLPNETFRDVKVIRIGGKTVSMIHPGRGHTDGDLVVHFAEDNSIHAGDLFFNKYYPNIDLEAGGSIRQWTETLDQVFKLPFEKVIPGHGELSDSEGMAQFQSFLNQLVEVGETAVGTGAGLTETVELADFTEDEGYREIYVPFVLRIDRAFVLKRAWEEFSGK